MFDVIPVELVVAQSEQHAASPFDLALNAQGVTLGVLILLVIFSAASWFVIGFKWVSLRRARGQSVRFLETFWQSKRLDTIFQASERLKRSPVSKVFRAGYVEMSKLKTTGGVEGSTMQGQLGGIENVQRALGRATTSEVTVLERLLPFLASVGSTAPFVGLFGTVWGIMEAFFELNQAAQETLSITTVSGPIAEALIATALGLFAAIPAVLAYNFFHSRVKVLASEMENFSNDFLNIVKRHFFK